MRQIVKNQLIKLFELNKLNLRDSKFNYSISPINYSNFLRWGGLWIDKNDFTREERLHKKEKISQNLLTNPRNSRKTTRVFRLSKNHLGISHFRFSTNFQNKKTSSISIYVIFSI